MDQQYVIHNIEESLSLPPEVLSIVEHFNAPLTPDLATITRKSLSLGSFEIHQEALASPVPSLLDVSVDKTRLENTTKDSKEIPVTHAIDTTLQFVKKLRLVSSPEHIHRFGSCPTYGTWVYYYTWV
ncbi:hypothetical protein M413DRAFT_443057, partial [Hebeloma cylindrosporum]